MISYLAVSELLLFILLHFLFLLMPRLTVSIPKHFICWELEQSIHLFVDILPTKSPTS